MSARPSDPKRWFILLAVMLAFLPVVIDMTILHIAVPTLTQALGASHTQVLWIIDIYPLMMAGLLVPMGTLADRIGTRRILLTGLVVFGAASTLAAFAPNAPMLIAARVMLALGGSMIMPCVLGVIRKTFDDPAERAMALGLWGTVGAAGAAVGPLVGGALLAHFWWGSVFLINLPVMLIVAPVAYALLPRAEARTPGAWRFGQAILLIIGMISVVYSIKAGFGGKQSIGTVLAILAFGALMLGLFARQQLRAPEPMLDLSLLSRPAIVAGMIMAVVATSALAGVELTLAQELQYVLDRTPLQAGIFMIPIMLASGVGGPVAGYLSNRFGLRNVATLALLSSAASLATLAQLDFHDPGWVVPMLLALLGLALSIGLTASSIAIMGAVEAEKGGAAGALEATSYELGSGLGITLFGVFMSSIFTRMIVLPEGIAPDMADAAMRSIGDSYLVAAQMADGTALIAAAKAAFTDTHAVLLTTSAALIGALACLVFVLLAHYRAPKPDHIAG
ncbi:MFS transporter [Ketogulonicigenium vulgare]|uniref:Major facilitator superfamily MFS_1 n=1 Tax=Ketogulonicigenium vulgare (strain WSH-001) TaxID=759362 RepID=F9Y602_KETVW|nr:MFS transporter [Ketogulonicigenium vulgare]AEM40827.1 Major facilitator superfamily MFS_1 [Ketogulonicigenium vulgare WSH-001]ALJ80992.1 methyl viologen resistance protein SmvA [Ketogulonicigenium vulgare]ANW33757.1 methyl viologen resistance protein SmvA [Ketogulonicigenium vulgare]AOZ54545.1 major facilitator superfamily protein [Ketogulonicigenium vulgare]